MNVLFFFPQQNSKSNGATNGSNHNNGNAKRTTKQTFIQELFEGTLTNDIKCLTCETVTSRDESFLDLSLDIEQNTSLSRCLKHFGVSGTIEIFFLVGIGWQKFFCAEKMFGREKFFCGSCQSKQEAQKQVRIKKLPPVLVLHLKRFKFVEQVNKF